MKKVLVIDDSALMRRVISDIIDSTNEYRVEYTASNGKQGLEIIEQHCDELVAVISDINMPIINGLKLLKILNERQISVPVIAFSSENDYNNTITALELGAIDFIKKPDQIFFQSDSEIQRKVYSALSMAEYIREQELKKSEKPENKTERSVSLNREKRKLVALCCSTGGPRALQYVIPKLPKNLAAPVLVVQHMPQGFTNSLALRLDDLSEIRVKEADEGAVVKNGTVYIAKGGRHLTLYQDGACIKIKLDDSPPVVGLKPCGNLMYKSLITLPYDEIVCVILTGMGADGTKGIEELVKKRGKGIYVISQNEASSTVYGMPKAVYEKGLVNSVCDLNDIANEIIKKVGVL